MNVKILFPIACLMACDPKSEPKKEKSLWDEIKDAGYGSLFSDEGEKFGKFLKVYEKAGGEKNVNSIKKFFVDLNLKTNDINSLNIVTKITEEKMSIKKDASGKWTRSQADY